MRLRHNTVPVGLPPSKDDDDEKESKMADMLKNVNMFPEYVEHGDFAIVARGLVKTVLAIVILIAVGSSILHSKLQEPMPSVRMNKDKDKRLGSPSYEQYLDIYKTVKAKQLEPLTCACATSQLRTETLYDEGVVQLQGEHERRRGLSSGDSINSIDDISFFRMLHECNVGSLNFALLKKYPVAYSALSGLTDTKTRAPCTALTGSPTLSVAGCSFIKRYRLRVGVEHEHWNVSDFKTQAELETEMVGNWQHYFEIRNISIARLCGAAHTLIEKNKNAYLTRFLSSPNLMADEVLWGLLTSRFQHMKDLSLSTFNIAYEQDTFRLDFEGVVSQWGKHLNGYLDSLHSRNTGAMLEAYQDALEYVLSNFGATTPLPGTTWEGEECMQDGTMVKNYPETAARYARCAPARAMEQFGFWFPDVVPTEVKRTPPRLTPVVNKDGKTTKRDHMEAGDYVLPADGASFAAPAKGKESGIQGGIVYTDNLRRDDGPNFGQCWSDTAVVSSAIDSDYTQGHLPGLQNPYHFRPTCSAFNLWDTPSKEFGHNGWQGNVQASHQNTFTQDLLEGCIECCPTVVRYPKERRATDAGWPLSSVASQLRYSGDKYLNPVIEFYMNASDGVDQLAVFVKKKCWAQCRYGGGAGKLGQPNLYTEAAAKAKCAAAVHDRAKCETAEYKDAGCFWAGIGDHTMSNTAETQMNNWKYAPASASHAFVKNATDKALWRPLWAWLQCCPRPAEASPAVYFNQREYTNFLPWEQDVVDNWWSGQLPAKQKVGSPTGEQLQKFTNAILTYQAYCARNDMPSMPLYDINAPRQPKASGTGAEAPPPHSETKMKRWVKELFSEWARGDLQMPLDEEGRVPFDTREGVDCDEAKNSTCQDYGQGRDVCARLPAVVNYVSECDCYAEPMCESSIEHKYTFFVGTARIATELNLRTPVPIRCSYFRQLEVFSDEQKAIKGYSPFTDITLRTFCDNGVRPTCDAGYKYNGIICEQELDPSAPALDAACADGSVAKTRPLQLGINISMARIQDAFRDRLGLNLTHGTYMREALQNGFVSHWDDQLNEKYRVKIFRAYFQKCKPTDCFYDVPQKREFATILTIFLGILGGLATLVLGGVDAVVNAVTGVVFGVKRLDILELHDKHAAAAVERMAYERKIEKAKARAREGRNGNSHTTSAQPPARGGLPPPMTGNLVATLVPHALSEVKGPIREI